MVMTYLASRTLEDTKEKVKKYTLTEWMQNQKEKKEQVWNQNLSNIQLYC